MQNALTAYRQKRDFEITPEPRGAKARRSRALAFVIQKHAARTLHYDFRLEIDGTLKSWAVPKGPSLDPSQKRMAVHVEDHPLGYGSFEGEIPPGQYGAGSVIVWDRGTWEPVGDASEGYRAGKLKFRLDGEKLHGMWALVRMHGRASERQEPWLLIKERDEYARPAAESSVVDALPDSVVSGRAVGPSVRQSTAVTSTRPKTATQRKAAKATLPEPSKATRPVAANMPQGAIPAKLPETLAPELATLVASAPAGDDWAYEIKFDGYRILARIEGADVRLMTRNGNDWTARLESVANELRRLDIPSGWLDGEIVVIGKNGASDFGALQNAFESGGAEIHYFAFDLPYFGGYDLRAVKLADRRALLATLLADARDKVRFSQDFAADASDILRSACRMGLEGVIGKRLGSPYVQQRTRDWIKLKCTLRQEFVIAGYTEPQGARTGLGALLLGIHDERGQLRYAGSVGTGFDMRTLAALRKKLAVLETPQSPFVEKPRVARVTWVEPKLIAEVSFAEWTKDGKVRQAVFHGLRNDKPPEAIGRERPAAAPRSASARAATSNAKTRPSAARPPVVRVTHPERVIDSSTQLTKQDLVDYYLHAAPRILPHLAARPVALVRAPAGVEGQLFFQKHSGTLKIVDIVELPAALDPGNPPLLEIDSFSALISAAQMNVVEFHTWNATSRNIEKPDRMTFDLDPGAGVQWPLMLEAARLTRALLEELGLRSFLKTSGGKGLHIVVPLAPRDGWDDVKNFSHEIVERLTTLAPEKLVSKSGAKNRVGKIYVDYLRNGRGATTAAAYSARARPGLGVAVPCGWDELDELRGGDHWNIRTVQERLEASADPWADFAGVRQTLSAARKVLSR